MLLGGHLHLGKWPLTSFPMWQIMYICLWKLGHKGIQFYVQVVCPMLSDISEGQSEPEVSREAARWLPSASYSGHPDFASGKAPPTVSPRFAFKFHVRI